MKHRYFGKKLSRSSNQRKQLLRLLSRNLIIHGKIKTSLAKAKAVQPMIEKLITHAKKASNASVNQIRKVIQERMIADALLKDAKDRFNNREGGYTRIVKLDTGRSDAAPEVILEFVDRKIEKNEQIVKQEKETGKKSLKNKKIPKKPNPKSGNSGDSKKKIKPAGKK